MINSIRKIMEYIELCKTIRNKIAKGINAYNGSLVSETTENHESKSKLQFQSVIILKKEQDWNKSSISIGTYKKITKT